MVHSPGMFPVVSKLAGKACFNAIISLTSAVVRWPLEGAMLCTLWPWKGTTGAYGLNNNTIYLYST